MPNKAVDNTIYLNEVACRKYELTINEAIDLLAIDHSGNGNTRLSQLLDKKLIFPEYDANYNITQWHLTENGKNTLISLIADSKGSTRTDDQLVKLCAAMQEFFPTGKKLGASGMPSYYWKGNTMEVVNKLKRYFTKFGDSYTDEEIIDATKRYVESFHGDYRYMRILKYFIYKREPNAAGELEETSDLLTFLENKNQENEQAQRKEDWTQTLV